MAAEEYHSNNLKQQYAFTAIPAGVGLLSPCNRILATKPKVVWLNQNKQVFAALKGRRTLLRKSTKDPTRCRELVPGWPDFVGIVNSSCYWVGGVVLGELLECIPTVFWWEWPEDIWKEIRSFGNPIGSITNSDLEMVGLLLLWLVIEDVCGVLVEKRVALFNNNMPTVAWVLGLASRKSLVAEQFVQALALQL
jgi:hypothetical protein